MDFRSEHSFDGRLQHPFSLVVSGPSNSGKTFFVKDVLVIDDQMQSACDNVEVQNVFTKYVHHRNLSCIYIVQNLFIQGKASRTISLNTNYLVLFKNPRDKCQIALLGRQMFPGNTKYFLEAFNDATSPAYGYLLIDYKAKTPDHLRLRTALLSEQPVVYIPKKQKEVRNVFKNTEEPGNAPVVM